MEHRLSYWRSLLAWRRTCRCAEHWPCIRYRQQHRPVPAINPDMDQPCRGYDPELD